MPAPSPERERGVDLELPFVTKLLLIAGYAASHNPPDSDTRYFSRRGSGRRTKEPATGSVSCVLLALLTLRAYLCVCMRV